MGKDRKHDNNFPDLKLSLQNQASDHIIINSLVKFNYQRGCVPKVTTLIEFEKLTNHISSYIFIFGDSQLFKMFPISQMQSLFDILSQSLEEHTD